MRRVYLGVIFAAVVLVGISTTIRFEEKKLSSNESNLPNHMIDFASDQSTIAQEIKILDILGVTPALADGVCTWGPVCDNCNIWESSNGVKYCCAGNCNSGWIDIDNDS